MPKPSPAADGVLVARFSEWKERGPLYAYRQRSKLTMGGVASTLGVSIGTVQNLEDGNRDPRDKPYWPALCRMLRHDRKNIGELWEHWLKSKPLA
jgi:DNA-binding XRE family transcriptional regulator